MLTPAMILPGSTGLKVALETRRQNRDRRSRVDPSHDHHVCVSLPNLSR